MRLIQNICYHEPKFVFKIDDVKYFAADAAGVSKFSDGLVINLCNRPNMPAETSMPLELLVHMQLPYKEIMVPWPDGEIPLVKSSFWKGLHEYASDQGYEKVCIHCEAGHGRTGTALSAIAIANLGWSAEQAINNVRLKHCRYMVETFDQTTYLGALDEAFNNREVFEEDLPVPSMVLLMEDIKSSKDD